MSSCEYMLVQEQVNATYASPVVTSGTYTERNLTPSFGVSYQGPTVTASETDIYNLALKCWYPKLKLWFSSQEPIVVLPGNRDGLLQMAAILTSIINSGALFNSPLILKHFQFEFGFELSVFLSVARSEPRRWGLGGHKRLAASFAESLVIWCYVSVGSRNGGRVHKAITIHSWVIALPSPVKLVANRCPCWH